MGFLMLCIRGMLSHPKRKYLGKITGCGLLILYLKLLTNYKITSCNIPFLISMYYERILHILVYVPSVFIVSKTGGTKKTQENCDRYPGIIYVDKMGHTLLMVLALVDREGLSRPISCQGPDRAGSDAGLCTMH